MQRDLKRIKKHYGEDFAHLCRSLFPTILETEGLLYELISSKFAFNRSLYSDLIQNNCVFEFRDYILSFIEEEKELLDTGKSPFALMYEVGYNLFECKTEEDIQEFRMFYEKQEELCTFVGGRLNTHYVFFAVKNNAIDLNRKDFIKPNRQDEYGTSVISIQFTKGDINRVSIKNRYNHYVGNSDATFGNDLEKIVPGLTKSFNDYYDLKVENQRKSFEMPNYVKTEDGKYYKYNLEINNGYFCTNNVIVEDKTAYTYDKEKYIVMDQFILDLVNKKIEMYDFKNKRYAMQLDSFVNTIPEIKKIDITKDGIIKYVTLITEEGNIIIVLDEENNIIGYRNNIVSAVKSNFLSSNRKLKYLEMHNLKQVGYFFCFNNEDLEKIDLSSLDETITGLTMKYFFYKNHNVKIDIRDKENYVKVLTKE